MGDVAGGCGDAGWLYLVVDAEASRRSLVAMSVADLDAELAGLRGRGIEPETVEQVGTGAAKADPPRPRANTDRRSLRWHVTVALAPRRRYAACDWLIQVWYISA